MKSPQCCAIRTLPVDGLSGPKHVVIDFDVLLTVHLSLFIFVINPYPTNVENRVSS